MKRIGQLTETQAAPKYNALGRLISKACRQLARKTFGKLENNIFSKKSIKNDDTRDDF